MSYARTHPSPAIFFSSSRIYSSNCCSDCNHRCAIGLPSAVQLCEAANRELPEHHQTASRCTFITC